MKKTDIRQARFAEEYLIDLNATAAAKRAGYKGTQHALEVTASRLLRNADVRSLIEAGQKKRSERVMVKADQVLMKLVDIAFADPRSLMNWQKSCCSDCWKTGAKQKRNPKRDPNQDCESCGGEGIGQMILTDTRKLTAEAAALYAGVKQSKESIQVQTHDQMKALELLGDHLGLFVKKMQITGKDGAPLNDALSGIPEKALRSRLEELANRKNKDTK